MRGQKKGMSTLEYVVLIVIVVTALLSMQIYLKRAVCGRWRESADVFGYGRQFDPERTE